MNTEQSTPSPSVYWIGGGLGLTAAGLATAFFAWYSLITTTVQQAATIFATTPTADPTAGAKAFLVVGGAIAILGAIALIVGIVLLAQGVDFLVKRAKAPVPPAVWEG